MPALVRPLRPLAPKPGFSKPLLKPLPVYKQGQTERQAWLAGMYSCFAFPSLTCFSKLAEQKMLTFCSSWSWPHWGLWPPSGSAPSSPPLLPLPASSSSFVEELRGKRPFFKLACSCCSSEKSALAPHLVGPPPHPARPEALACWACFCQGAAFSKAFAFSFSKEEA